MKKYLYLLPVFGFALSGAHAAGVADDVTAIVTTSSTLLSAIYPVVIGAVGFGIFISLVKMVRRK